MFGLNDLRGHGRDDGRAATVTGVSERDQARVGVLLRKWRQRRKLSQLELALKAGSSARHVSCVETGRAQPSREMVLRLAATLDVPLRERNTLLLAAGYAPAYRESGLDDDGFAAVRAALDTMLTAHEPYPAVVVDRWWNVRLGNRAMTVLTGDTPEHLLAPAPNVFRLVLHPDGLAPKLVNYGQVRSLFLERLHRQVEETGDPHLEALLSEVRGYPAPPGAEGSAGADPVLRSPVEVPLRVRTPHGELAMFSTMATFGAPGDVTLSELAIELFYPLDDATAALLRGLGDVTLGPPPDTAGVPASVGRSGGPR